MNLLTRCSREVIEHVEFGIGLIPGTLGRRVRSAYYRRRFCRLGSRVTIETGLQVQGAYNVSIGDEFACLRNCIVAAGEDGSIQIGDRVSLNTNVHINACERGRIVIGDDVLVGPNVVMRASDHVAVSVGVPIRQQGHTGGEISVENDVWLGANVVVVGSVSIGRGAVVAASAVVTRSVDPYTVVGGVPARFIRRRGD